MKQIIKDNNARLFKLIQIILFIGYIYIDILLLSKVNLSSINELIVSFKDYILITIFINFGVIERLDNSKKNIKEKIINFFSIYLIIYLIHLIINRNYGINIIRFPIELLGLQSLFINYEFGIFYSYMWVASYYLVFILFNKIIDNYQNEYQKNKRILFVAICFFVVYLSIINVDLENSIVLGILLFMIGRTITDIYLDVNKKNNIIVLLSGLLICFGLLICSKVYNLSFIISLSIIIIAIIVYILLLLKVNIFKKIDNIYSLLLPFYLFNYLIAEKYKFIENLLVKRGINHGRMIIIFLALIIITIIFYYIQKCVKILLLKLNYKVVIILFSILCLSSLVINKIACYYSNTFIELLNKNEIIDVKDFTLKGKTNSKTITVYLNNKEIDEINVLQGLFEYKLNNKLLNEGWNYIEFRVHKFLGISEPHSGGAINNILYQPDIYVPDNIIKISRNNNLKNRDDYQLNDAYDYYKNYIGAGNLQEGIDFSFDENGYPLVKMNDFLYYHPVFISAYALNVYKDYLENEDSKKRNVFLKMADWFIDNNKNGAFEYPFEWSVGKIKLEKTWTSSMAQGRALSVLSRAYYLTKDNKYLKAGNKILKYMVSLDKNNSNDGTAKLLYDFTNKYDELKKYNDYIIYDTYVGNPGSYVLNGNLFALLGLYDWYRLDKNDYGSNVAKKSFDMGIKSTEILLPYYDYYGWSSYGLYQYTNDDYINLGNRYAHRCHLQLLYILYTKTDSQKLKKYVDIFENYYKDDFWIQSKEMYKD